MSSVRTKSVRLDVMEDAAGRALTITFALACRESVERVAVRVTGTLSSIGPTAGAVRVRVEAVPGRGRVGRERGGDAPR